MSISALACWIVGSLNWSATRWACFKPELLSCARGGSNPLSSAWKQVLWFTLVYMANSTTKVQYMLSLLPIGTRAEKRFTSKIHNFCYSALFHSAASTEIYHTLIHFCMDLFSHKYSICTSHTRDSFEQSITFSISASRDLLAVITIVITIPLQWSILASRRFTVYCGARNPDRCGSLAPKLECMGLQERQRMYL